MRILHSFTLLLARLKVQLWAGPIEAAPDGTFYLQSFYIFRLPLPLCVLRASKRANIHNYSRSWFFLLAAALIAPRPFPTLIISGSALRTPYSRTNLRSEF